MKGKKTKPIITRERIIESVYHIAYFGNTARQLHSTFISIADKIDNKEKQVIRYSIQSNLLLDTISLLDELNNFLFKFEKNIDLSIEKKIEAYSYIIQPILIEFQKWVTFRKFRNNVLAHNFRIDNDNFKSVHLSNELHNYIIPDSTMDLLILFQYFNHITTIAEEIFRSEYNEALDIIQGFQRTDKVIKQSIEDETNKINKILAEVNDRISEYNKNKL